MNGISVMLTGDELINELKVIPYYDSSIKDKPMAERLLALDDIYRIYIPSEMSVEIYTKLYLSIMRNVQTKQSKDAVKLRNANYGRIKKKDGYGTASGISSFTILGPSGIGKSSAIEQALSIISTDNYFSLQIQCPFDCSVKSMLMDILKQVDEYAGTNHYEQAIKARATTDILIASVSNVLINYVSILIIDEIQNIVNHRGGSQLCGALTQLINYSGVPVVMVGIPESEAFFQQTEYLARRAIGLHYDIIPYGTEFIDFCKTIYDYQYTKTADSFTESHSIWLYEHSGGAIAIVVSLIKDAQEIAITSGSDHLSIAALDEAYKKRYGMIKRQKLVSIAKMTKQSAKLENINSESKQSFFYADIVKQAKEKEADILTELKTVFKIVEVQL